MPLAVLSLLAVFPYTPFKGSRLYTTMASAAAGAQGVRDALDVLITRGKMPAEDDIEVVLVAGDGSAYDMALASTSGAIFRELDSGASITDGMTILLVPECCPCVWELPLAEYASP
jgi:pyruvate/2-oxoacid:ferredoxin oxidoreductase beta subunit